MYVCKRDERDMYEIEMREWYDREEREDGRDREERKRQEERRER